MPKLLKILVCLWALISLADCTDAADVPGNGVVDDAYCKLVVSVDLTADVVPATQSRSAFDDFDNEDDKWGIPGENMEMLRVLILDGTGVVEVNRTYSLTDGTYAGEYEYRVRRHDTKTVCLVANEAYYSIDEAGMEIPGGTTSLTNYLDGLVPGTMVNLNDLKAMTLALKYNSPDGRGMSLRTPLPITAIYTERIDDQESISRCYDIHRAAVKYSFRIVNESVYPHRLEKLRIDRIADREFLFPDADWTTNNLGHTVLKDYRTPQTANEGLYEYVFTSSLELPARMTKAVEALPSPIYVPEGLKGDAAQQVSITLDGADLDVWCDLLWRMPGETVATRRPMVDLPRNTHVIVNITIKEDNRIVLVADVQPYAGVELDPWFGFERDPNGNIIIEHLPDGTYKVLINNEEVRLDADGDRIITDFEDGSVLCEEVVYKDYSHDASEVEYRYKFEKDAPGGNMVICRPSGAVFRRDEEMEDANHKHGMDDRPMFILDKQGVYKRVVYDKAGNPVHYTTDVHDDRLVQVNGYQYRDDDFMQQYLGTYLAEMPDGSVVLRDCFTGEPVEWNPAQIGRFKYTRKL